MRTIRLIVCIVSLSVVGLARGESRSETMSDLSRTAADKLERSTQELDELRTQIASEKLPLAQELTALEEKLLELRREYDRVARLVDAGNLDLPGIKADTKRRQDEIAYIGNLLDEYARTFESKIDVSEMQTCGSAIEAAKAAGESSALTVDEKLERQVGFADFSMQRLFDLVGGMRFPGVGVDMQGTLVSGTFAIIGPVALFCAAGGEAGLVVPQSGSTNPLIRPLEGALQAGIVSLVEAGEGLLPLDPSRGGALKALVQKTNLLHVFEKGGPIMWPLLLASILALGTVIERVLFLMFQRWRRDPKALDLFFAAVGQGRIDEAIRIGNESRFFVVRALAYALSHKEQSLASAVLYAQAQELKRWRRGIPILDTVITLAPLLGLLGTVVGMMGSFSLIGGDLGAPGAITGGIAEALIATAFGLGIAITCLLPFNFLNTKMEDARHEIDSAATQLELLLTHPSHPSHPSHPAPGAPEVDFVIVPREGHDRPAGREEAARRKTELRQRREALQRQMAELELELEQRDRGHPAVASQPGSGKE